MLGRLGAGEARFALGHTPGGLPRVGGAQAAGAGSSRKPGLTAAKPSAGEGCVQLAPFLPPQCPLERQLPGPSFTRAARPCPAQHGRGHVCRARRRWTERESAVTCSNHHRVPISLGSVLGQLPAPSDSQSGQVGRGGGWTECKDFPKNQGCHLPLGARERAGVAGGRPAEVRRCHLGLPCRETGPLTPPSP